MEETHETQSELKPPIAPEEPEPKLADYQFLRPFVSYAIAEEFGWLTVEEQASILIDTPPHSLTHSFHPS